MRKTFNSSKTGDLFLNQQFFDKEKKYLLHIKLLNM